MLPIPVAPAPQCKVTVPTIYDRDSLVLPTKRWSLSAHACLYRKGSQRL